MERVERIVMAAMRWGTVMFIAHFTLGLVSESLSRHVTAVAEAAYLRCSVSIDREAKPFQTKSAALAN